MCTIATGPPLRQGAHKGRTVLRSVRCGVLEHAVEARVDGARPRLDDVRGALLRQEDSIIFALIERAQFLRNEAVYIPDGVPIPAYTPDGRCFTFFEYLLRDTEAVHGRIRRYTSPDEHAFFPDALPAMVSFCKPGLQCTSCGSCTHHDGCLMVVLHGCFAMISPSVTRCLSQVLKPVPKPTGLAPGAHNINLNKKILPLYLETILPGITQPGDDGNYGSSAMLDVLALQVMWS